MFYDILSYLVWHVGSKYDKRKWNEKNSKDRNTYILNIWILLLEVDLKEDVFFLEYISDNIFKDSSIF